MLGLQKFIGYGIAALLAFSDASAEIIINVGIDTVNDRNGVNVPWENGVWFVSADTTRDGFGPIAPGPITVGSVMAGDDLILYAGDFGTFATDGVVVGTSPLTFIGDFGEGDPFAFVWFPELDRTATEVSSGDSYGLYTDPVGINTSQPWFAPQDGRHDYALHLISNDTNGFFGQPTNPVDEATSSANFIVIPEPSATTLALLASLCLLRRQHRR